jgi:hypothetical protein
MRNRPGAGAAPESPDQEDHDAIVFIDILQAWCKVAGRVRHYYFGALGRIARKIDRDRPNALNYWLQNVPRTVNHPLNFSGIMF